MFFTGMLIFTSCTKKTDENTKNVKVICTIFPEYDWVRNIITGVEGIECDVLIKNGVDLHSYQPSVPDVAKIISSSLFVYGGGESDSWVKDVVSSHKDIRALNVMNVLDGEIFEEEIIEGMEDEEEEEDGGDEPEYDEHVWLSLRLANKICEKICDELCEIKPEATEQFKKNYEEYSSKLTSLDKEFANAVPTSTRRTLLFADRFPFRYLTEDYNLKYYAAFVGCSAETEASFETMKFLTGKLNEEKLPVVLVLESSDQKIARTVIANSEQKNQKILVINSIQSVTSEEISAGVSYLALMKDNLEVIFKALN